MLKNSIHKFNLNLLYQICLIFGALIREIGFIFYLTINQQSTPLYILPKQQSPRLHLTVLKIVELADRNG